MKRDENVVIFFLNCRHPYFYRDRYKLLCCPHVKGTGRELRPLTHFLSVCSFLKALFETFLKTFRAYYFPFMLKKSCLLYLTFYYYLATHSTLSFVKSQWCGSLLLMITLLETCLTFSTVYFFR